jgi:chromosomal replication initiation ATPase DnaA
MKLIDRAAELFDLDRADLLGPGRGRQVSTARHALAYVLHRRCPYMSLGDIARVLGRRDHSTIASSLLMARRLLTESYFADRVAILLDEVSDVRSTAAD